MTTMFKRKKKIMREREPVNWFEVGLMVAMAVVAVVAIYCGGA